MALVGAYEDSGGQDTYVRRRAAPTADVPSGGIAAPSAGPAPAPAPAPLPDSPPEAPPPPRYGLTGFDTTKLADPNHNTFKYQYGRIARGYNPQQGIQSGMLDELNKLGFAQFSGSGQRLGWSGVTDAGRAAGMDPYDFSGDFIQGWQNGQNPNALWQYDWRDPNAGQQPEGSTPDLSALFPQWNPTPQYPGMPPGTVSITNSGIDPAALQALASMFSQQQPQSYSAPPYQPSAPQTQAAPMPEFTGASGGSGSVQTQSAAPTAAPGMDPFMEWLRSQVFGGQA